MSDYPVALPLQQLFDDNGAPLAGGKLYSYQAGTSTPQATYADASGTLNTNPLVLDASGRGTYYLPAGTGYKFNLTNASGVQVTGYPLDNVMIPAPVAPPAPAAVPTGAVLPYAGSSAPTSYLLCDGTAIDRSTYAALFSAIGTAYGAGDGSTTFNVPDLRQRFPLGKAASGTGATLGVSGGTINHTHTYTDVINHTHVVSVTDPGHTHTQNAHTHGLTDPGHTHTQSSHSHAITDPGHTHTQNSHTHGLTDPGHTHTQNAHAHGVTDPGHTHTISVTDPGHYHTTFGDNVAVTSGSDYALRSSGSSNTSTATTGITASAISSSTGVSVNGATATNNSNTTGVTVNSVTATNNSNTTSISVNSATAVNNSNTTGVTANNATATNNSNTTGISASTAVPVGGVATGTTASNNPPYLVFNYIIKT